MFHIGSLVMSFVFLLFKLIDKRDGMGIFHVVEAFSLHLLHQRVSYQLYWKNSRTQHCECISGLKVLCVCLCMLYSLLQKYTHFNFVISKHTNLKKYQDIQVPVQIHYDPSKYQL